jgi:hypothetical protein
VSAPALPRLGPDGRIALLILTVTAISAGVASWALGNASYDTVVGGGIGISLAVVSVVAGRAIARRETDPVIARLLVVAPVLKLAMSIVRFAVAFVVYDGSADAAVYHQEGVRLQASYAQGIFDAELGRPFVGTGFVRMLTGLLYTVTGPTMLGAFFVFSFLGFWGLYLSYRAFCTAVPEGDHRRYAFLVLLLPSLLFWPSSLGKEAWMTFGLGLFSLGAARVIVHRRHGFLLAAGGLLVTGVVRPHVAAMAAVALLAAYLTRRAPKGASITSPLKKLVGLAVLGAVLMVAVGEAQTLLGIDRFNAEAVESARTYVETQTGQGGSAFENAETDFEPSKLPVALGSVLFRPYPWEAGNAQSVIASIEGLAVLTMFVIGWRRLVGAVRSVLVSPYVVLSLVYTVLFAYGFSSFTNFGILTRQRVQVLPFALVILCVPPFRGGRRDLRRLLVDAAPQTSRAAPVPARP